MNSKVSVGIIGGTGIDQDSSLLKEKKLVDLVETPYGWASDKQAISGVIEGVPVYIISRHGKEHNINPSNVNYRANLWTLVKQLGCTHVLVTSACGSLKEELVPGHVGILNQYYDNTSKSRSSTFYKVCHVEQKAPINKTMQGFIEQTCKDEGIPCHKDLTCVTIEGPRFSSLAESRIYREIFKFDVVNMTSVPEVPLATELATMYACILLITDYDCWRESDEETVNATLVVERMKDLGAKVRKIIPGVIKKIAAFDWSEQKIANEKSLASSIMAQ